MNELEQAAIKFVEATKEFLNLTNAISIDFKRIGHTREVVLEVHLDTEEQFNAVVGNHPVSLVKRDSLYYPYQKEAVIGGVKFFCLLEEEQ